MYDFYDLLRLQYKYILNKYIDLAKPKSGASSFWLVLIIFENSWACDPMKIHNLISDKLSKNTWPRKVLHLSSRHGQVKLVSGYFVLTAVNWPWNGSPISICKDISCMHKLTQVDLYIFFGRNLARLCCLIKILRDYNWARDMVMWHWTGVSCFDSCQLTRISNVI